MSIAAVPAAIQTSCRITRGSSSVLCEPAYEALMTLTRPMPASARTMMNRVQSK